MTHGARRLLAESPAPRMDVARGFAVTAVEELLERFAAEPHTAEVDLGHHAGELRVLRWQLDPAVAEVAAPEPLEIDGAAIRTPAGTMLVDSRAAPASLRFAHGGRSLEVSIERGHVRLYALASAELPVFEPRVATGGEALSGWLAEHVEALRSAGEPIDALAAAGALLRFFTPAAPDDAGTGAPQVVRGVRAWARSIDEAALSEVEARAAARAARLASALEGEALDGPSLALERDVLESVATVLRLARPSASLAEALRALDRKARARLSALTERARTVDDPRLTAVSWSEPEAWWGTLAR